MNFKSQAITYFQTGYFSAITTDYIDQRENLRPFYQYLPSEESLDELIANRSAYEVNRSLLADTLKEQYKDLDTDTAVLNNIALLRSATTFTITTAHQPNIFTGPLYFIYKILHAIKLAEHCRQKFPQYDFVPVYYMGSEDADLDELGHIHLNGEKLAWQTTQVGAVGRMKVDNELMKLVDRIASEIGIQPYGGEIMAAVKQFYAKGQNIQDATIGFVNYIFGKYGLVIVMPDNAKLKSVALGLFKDELLNQRSFELVQAAAEKLAAAGYKPQAHGRDINLFYLKDDGARLRIEKRDNKWVVLDSDTSFTKDELLAELETHPERFSPNVILRGIFQEMILPNLVFIGGGGELAYWLELKGIFEYYGVPYPMLVLRNSFLVVSKSQAARAAKMGFELADLFKNKLHLQSIWVRQHSDKNILIDDTMLEASAMFDKLSSQAGVIDTTLKAHIYALQKQFEKKITEVGKKFLRAEKRNHADAMRQVETLRAQLFPRNNLQERIDNILPYYAAWGPAFIDALYQHSYTLEQQFVILAECDLI